jgi:hypothetical protein
MNHGKSQYGPSIGGRIIIHGEKGKERKEKEKERKEKEKKEL